MKKLLLLVVVLIIATVGFGFYRGWFKFTAKEDPKDQKVDVGVKVDVAKVKADVGKASEKAEALGEKAKEKIEGISKDTTAKGEVDSIDDKDSSFTLTTADSKKLTLHVDADSKIQLNKEAIALTKLRKGDRVSATYHVKDGKNLARDVTVERGK